jgi:ribonuclease Z
MELVFLGTSAAVPTLHRSLSAVALCLEGQILLFDCGEGTQMQLRRAELRPTKISKIFISHLHGDHVNGLIGLLMTLEMETRQNRLDIYGPSELSRLITFLRRVLRTGFSYPVCFHPASSGLVCEEKTYLVEARELDHGVPCFGYAFQEKTKPGRFDVEKARALGIPPGPLYGEIQRGATITLEDGRSFGPDDLLGTSRPGRRVVYAVDTRPCAGTLNLARDADVLVHEATFSEEFADKARERNHSTGREAALVAQAAGVHQLILTHLSSRFFTAQPVLQEARKTFPKTDFAADLQVFPIPPRPEGAPDTSLNG